MIVCGSDGPLDVDAAPHAQPALKNLLGNLPRSAATQPFAEQSLGKGTIAYIAGRILQRQVDSRQNENRTHEKRVCPAVVDPEAARSLLDAVAGRATNAASPRPLMAGRLPEGDDVELCLATNRRGEPLLLAVNWDTQPRSVVLRDDPLWARSPAEAYLLSADGRWAPWTNPVPTTLKLDPQQVLVVRWTAR